MIERLRNIYSITPTCVLYYLTIMQHSNRKIYMRKLVSAMLAIFTMFTLTSVILAQSDLAAVLEVVSAGVEVQRVNTEQWIPVSVEAIVGVGDVIRTNESGQARITFFSDGIETTIEPDSEYRIDVFNGDPEIFNISVSVLAGQTQQRLDRVLDPASNYDVITPGVNLVARGTAFRVRVEADGRSAMIVSEGVVDASNEVSAADVPAEFGIRANTGEGVSDVVRASNFDELDSALDGCTAILTTPDDVSLNVRIGADSGFPRVGGIPANQINLLKGINADNTWYRIDFRGGFGWVLSSTAEIQGECAGLRVFENGYGPEDVTLYEFVGDPVQLDDLITPDTIEAGIAGDDATDTPIAEATPQG